MSNKDAPTTTAWMETIMDINTAGVTYFQEGREEEAFRLFERGLNLCGVDICHFGIRLSSTDITTTTTNNNHKTTTTMVTPQPHHILHSIPISTTQEEEEEDMNIMDNDNYAFEFYSNALLVTRRQLDSQSQNEQDEKGITHHMGPILLYNLALVLHVRATKTKSPKKRHSMIYTAHELYRMSLFFMEENTLNGYYHKAFDLLLLALFNNLCQLNSSFYLFDRVALCREKLMLVLLHSDVRYIHSVNYAFFYEQLVFSANIYPTAAPAA